MDNKAFERGIDVVHLNNQQRTTGNDISPIQPQNPIQIEGYTSMGVCVFQQGSKLIISPLLRFNFNWKFNILKENNSTEFQRDPNQPLPHFQEYA